MGHSHFTKVRRVLVRPQTIVWLPASIYDLCCANADQHFPYETGGALMGYWVDKERVVVTASIEAGPNAIHNRYSFEPDYSYQRQRIADHYEASGRYDAYLGDWHTHPAGISGSLSIADRKALKRVATSMAARAPNPLSLILYGRPSAWKTACWCAAVVPRRILWHRLATWSAELHFCR
jgi:integrative and conjugative element protein (TIGR02256 family)